MSHVEAASWLNSVASPTLVNAFVKCVDDIIGASTPSVLEGSQSVSTDGNTIVFNLVAKLLANGQPDTLVVDTYATGATCSGALTQTGTVVPNAQPASAICTRVGTGPVSFVVVTTQGSYLFNAGGSGVTGSAWVTGAKRVDTEVTGRLCRNLTIPARSCGLKKCSDDHVKQYYDLGYGFTKFRNPTYTLMTNFSTIHGQNAWLESGDTKLVAEYWREGKHSVNLEVCADQYRVDTTYTDYKSPTVDVYGTKNFELRVDNAYEGKALHILTTDNDVLLQQLDATAYTSPFELVSKVPDPLKTTYLVKVKN